MSQTGSGAFTAQELRRMHPDRLFRVGDASVQNLIRLAGGEFNGMHPDRLFRVGDPAFQKLLDAAEKAEKPKADTAPQAPAAPATPAASDPPMNAEIALVNTNEAPIPPGPFSHATIVGNWVYSSGMGGLDPKTGQVVSDDVIEQTIQSIRNTEAILAAAGCTLKDVVKATVYLTDMADYPRVNAEYEKAFAPHKPARTCVAVSALPVRERMKIETVAIRRR